MAEQAGKKRQPSRRSDIEVCAWSISVDSASFGDWGVVLHQRIEGDELTKTAIRLFVPLAEAERLLVGLVGAVMNEQERRAIDIATGPCLLCDNTRLIEEENKHGRMERIRCPRCVKKYEQAREALQAGGV